MLLYKKIIKLLYTSELLELFKNTTLIQLYLQNQIDKTKNISN